MHRFLLLLASLFACAAAAQGWTPERIAAGARLAPDLTYPAQPSALSGFSGPQMALYKPEGDGPFPALVLLHQCGGLRGARQWQNMSMLEWARTAVGRGYVVLMVDSLGPRNVETVCMGPRNGVSFLRGARDALRGGAHLATLPYVDKERIAMAGYSWGAMVATLASSAQWAGALGDGFRFRAAAAWNLHRFSGHGLTVPAAVQRQREEGSKATNAAAGGYRRRRSCSRHASVLLRC